VKAPPTTSDATAVAFDEQTAQMIRLRLWWGAGTFLLLLAFAAFVELSGHPERATIYAVVYTAEVAVWGIGIALSHVFPRRGITIVVCVAIGLLALITAYHIRAGDESEILALALGYLTVGTMVLFPLGGLSQALVAGSAVAAYLGAVAVGVSSSTPIALNILGLSAIGALTIVSAAALEHHRRALHRQTADLQRANAALDEVNRAKTQFLANVSHELRTPLNAMIGYLQLIDEGTFGALPTAAHEPLSRVQANSQMLLRLLDDFLDLSRLEANRLSLHTERVPLRQVCEEASVAIEPQLRGRPIVFEVSVPREAVVTADRDRLRQVLMNLLSNAAKFTERGRIEVGSAAAEDGVLSIEVADTGMGISSTELELIFEPFRRSERAERVGGVGIGLALSRQLAEAMGGDLSVRSELGRGSVFTLRLPRAAAERAA
jgi:signal transduction histidine kinase